MRLDVVPDDLLSQDVPFDEVSILPDCPTTRNDAVESEEVVVVLLVVPVAEYSSSSSLQEMTVRLKQKISKMNNPFFIFSTIPKVKYYWLVY